MKHDALPTRVDESATAKQRRRTKVTQAPTAVLTKFKRLIDTRFRKVEGKMKEEIASLRGELRESDIVLAAAELRALNERQSHEGLGRLRADLKTMRELGKINEKGHRIRTDLPAEMLQRTACDV